MAGSIELTEANKIERLEALKRDLYGYVDENIQKIDANLPVFFGHVISRLEDSFPNIDDTTYDEFIDAIAFHIMDASPRAGDVEVIERISTNAARAKRRTKGKAILNVLAGLKLMKVGRYQNAIDYFGNYWKYDAQIGFYIAFCYTKLAEQERKIYAADSKRPSEMELAARELLIEVARVKPPIFRLRQLDIRDSPIMDDAFWEMMNRALEWFPEEKWFIQVGLQKARRDKNEEMNQRLLKFATEHFYNDMFFLRELYHHRLEMRDAAGAAGVIKQMMQQHPESLEPVYYGIKLSLLSAGRSSYLGFREMAVEREMPKHLLQLLDLAQMVMREEEHQASVELKDMKKRFPTLAYYFIAIEYLMSEILSGDEQRAKKAKKTLFDSIDRYALQVLKVQD
jgi:hypothetical protein